MSQQQSPQPPQRERRRRRAGRPLTLALGWLLSCALITAVTLTAVERVGREVSDTSSQLNEQDNTEPVAAASTSLAAPKPSTPAPTPSVPATSSPPVASARPSESSPRPTKSATPKPTPTAAPTQAPPPSPAPTTSTTPVGVEYVFVCSNGKAVGGAVTATSSPSLPPTASTSPSGSTSDSSSASSSTSLSASPSVSNTPSPSSSPTTSKSIIDVPGGRIVIACSGNSIANANATVTDNTYTLTVRSTSDPKVDIFLGKTS